MESFEQGMTSDLCFKRIILAIVLATDYREAKVEAERPIMRLSQQSKREVIVVQTQVVLVEKPIRFSKRLGVGGKNLSDIGLLFRCCSN